MKIYKGKLYRNYHAPKLALSVILLLSLAAGLTLLISTPAKALSSSDFQAGRIIDDFVFENTASMSVQDIQNFLSAKVPSCDVNGSQSYSYYYNSTTGQVSSSNSSVGPQVTSSRQVFGQRYDTYNNTTIAATPYVCLKDYVENTTTHANNLQGASVTGGTSAAQIIYNVAQTYDINPQVIIVTLQKEQGLVTDDWPWVNEFQEAMGYSCPDTPQGCSSKYAGFFTQVDSAAWQFRYYLDHNGSPGNYWTGNYYVPYNPTASCGGSVINIQNAATAALYDYTPYQPNSGALSGLSDSSPGGTATCGAYGNRNFWWYFNEWFGSTYSNDTFVPHPNGTLVSLGSRVYLVNNNTKQWITNGDVFNSYGYPWFQVKTGTAGDAKLPNGANLDTLAPGTIFRSDNSPVYVMTYENGSLVKKQISLSAFNSLGYSWNDVIYVPPGNVPAANSSSILFESQHPDGTLVAGNGKVYVLDQGSKRWILGPDAFTTNNFSWSRVKSATFLDLSLPDGKTVDLRQGNILFSNNNIYVVDYDASGIMKRPVGPWECFMDRWHYSYRDLYQITPANLPSRTGPVATC